MTPHRRRRATLAPSPLRRRRRPSHSAAAPPAAAPTGNPVSEWILEYLLRQPNIDDSQANLAFCLLSLSPPFSPRLQKTILLRRIASDLSRRSLSERTLHSLELIQELDRLSGAHTPSHSMKTAYCSVALDCTARFLREGNEAAFSDAVERIWKCRLGDLERSEGGELVSGLVEDGRNALESALVCPRVKDGLLKWDTEEEALDAVQCYWKEALEGIGPPFLDKAARVMGVLPSGLQERNADGGDAVILDAETTSGSPVRSIDKNREGEPARSKDATCQKGYSVCGIDCLPTPEVSKVSEALKTSSANLHMMVQDPLPDAVTTAAEVASRLGGGNKHDKRNGVTAVQVSSMIGGGNKSNDPNGVTAAEVASRLCGGNNPDKRNGVTAVQVSSMIGGGNNSNDPNGVTAAEVASKLGGGNKPDKRNGVTGVQVSSVVGGGNKSDDPNGVTTAEVASRIGGENKPDEPTGNHLQVGGCAGIPCYRVNIEVGCAERSYTRTADNKYCMVEMLSNLDGSPTSDTKESDGNQDVATEAAQIQSVREGVDATRKESTGTSVVPPAQFVCVGADTAHKEVISNSTSTREVAPARSVCEGGDATHKEGSSRAAEQNKASFRPRTRLMDRNPTACTLQWGDDSIESPSESSSNPLKRIRLPSPTRRFVSPLKVAEDITCRKRRKIKRWSVLEEDTLRKAVERHGAGNWKFIRSSYPKIFQDRTEVDLKDKWRNMTRH